MYSVLIMGGTDFIGSELSKYFINKKYNVDIMTRGIKPINYNGIRNHLICDRKNETELKNILKERKYDFIYDLSGKSKSDIEILLNNLNLDNLKKYIFILPKNNNKFQLDNEIKSIKNYIKSISIPYIIINYSNIYGYENDKNREIAIFKKIEKSQIIKVPKDKKVNMQFIYIEDFIKNLYSLVKSNHINETYNVTNPQVISLEEYINTYGEIIGKKPNIKYVDKEVTDDEFKEDFNINYLDIDKVIQHGLYIPNILFRDGISKVYDSYKESNKVKKTLKDKIAKALQIV